MSHKCKVLHLFLGKNWKGIEINVFQVKVLDAITWNNLSSLGLSSDSDSDLYYQKKIQRRYNV